jgi:hypothetical protein
LEAEKLARQEGVAEERNNSLKLKSLSTKNSATRVKSASAPKRKSMSFLKLSSKVTSLKESLREIKIF